ncbi:lamin tail domain-containing protein, partial [candidate division WWE3 bacterium]|nr:lamin tail domain-containing protein [candidate division WWE3 bacterium]
MSLLIVGARGVDALTINEALVDPAGTDTGNEWIELYNETCDAVDLSGYDLNAAGDYYTFPVFTLDPHSFITVHWRADGIDTTTDLYTGTVNFDTNMGNTSGSLSLFNDGVHSKNTIVDFVQYGAGGQSWEAAAIDAGIWTLDDAVTIGGSGESFGLSTDGQDGNVSTDWSVFTTLSPGALNNDSVTPPSCATPTPAPTATPTPTPTNTPTPTITPSPSPTITPSPTPTTAPSVTPTPTVAEPSVKITSYPKAVDFEKTFTIKGDVKNLDPSTQYYLKFEASPDGSTWYQGKTLGADGETMLSWNSGWSSYPTITTNPSGNAGFKIMAAMKLGESEQNYQVRVKVHPVEGSSNYYSDHKTIAAKFTLDVDPNEKPDVDNTVQTVTEELIVDAKKHDIGTLVRVTGIVTADLELLGSKAFYIEDDTAGVKVLVANPEGLKVKLGQKVTLLGELGEGFNELYIKVADKSGMNIAQNSTVRKPVGVQTGGVNEAKEGSLVIVSGRVTKTSGDT